MSTNLPIEEYRSSLQTLFSLRSISDKTVWEAICVLADALEQEAQQEPGKSFSLTEEESYQEFYPLYITLVDAARHMREFQRLFELLAERLGILIQKKSYSDYEVATVLDDGRNAIDTLSKTHVIARIYYYRGSPSDEMRKMVEALNAFFLPGNILLSELMPSEYKPVALGQLKNDIYQINKAIFAKEQGTLHRRFRNKQGILDFYQNGAIHITFDCDDDKKSADLEHKLYWNLAKKDVVNDLGSYHYGRLNTYTIPAGCPIDLVLQGLREVGFLSEQEEEYLREK